MKYRQRVKRRRILFVSATAQGTNGRFGVDCSGVRQLGSIFTAAEASTSHKQFI